MTRRALRIRHYIGMIVAGCSLGGLLLAFELAFLFQSIERRGDQLGSSTGNLGAVDGWGRAASAWIVEARAALDAPAQRTAVRERGRNELLVQLEKLATTPENGAYVEDFAWLRTKVEEALLGLEFASSAPTASNEKLDGFRKGFGELAQRMRESTDAIRAGLQAELETQSGALEERKDELWRTVGLSALGYAAMVLVLWRWVVWRLLTPLQALIVESRRTLDGESAFHLDPAGPHEVRVLNESLSTLVDGLISARGTLEDKVRVRTLELERANRAKNDFLANMSHEIRTPMTAILGYAELCLAPDIADGDRQRYAEIIHANGEHLLSVINDILDISKIEAGRMTVEPTLCSPFDVVNEVRALMEVRARAKGLELTLLSTGPVPEIVRTDPTRLRQILLNLVNNAIKFTEQGGVVLAFGGETSADGRDLLVFEVRDSGVGMSHEQIERVFQPFVQADTSTTRRYGGSGLGLAISQALARMLGGDLTCASELGQGSTFRFAIDPGPLDGVRRTERAPETGRERAPRHSTLPVPRLVGRVLLAEDVAVNRRLVATILERTGLEVSEAENGRLALERALEAQGNERPYDLVFMDMQMPEMDGYEATRRLRQAGFEGPIVALTSHSMPGERQRCLDAGCSDYMTKPVDRKVLLQVLGRFLSEVEEPLAS